VYFGLLASELLVVSAPSLLPSGLRTALLTLGYRLLMYFGVFAILLLCVSTPSSLGLVQTAPVCGAGSSFLGVLALSLLVFSAPSLLLVQPAPSFGACSSLLRSCGCVAGCSPPSLLPPGLGAALIVLGYRFFVGFGALMLLLLVLSASSLFLVQSVPSCGAYSSPLRSCGSVTGCSSPSLLPSGLGAAPLVLGCRFFLYFGILTFRCRLFRLLLFLVWCDLRLLVMLTLPSSAAGVDPL
jgi:hypothetical protein